VSGSRPNLADLWDFDRPHESEARFRKLLEQLKESEEPFKAEVMTQVARAEGLQGRFDDAHRTLDGVESAVDLNSIPRVHTRYLLERGRVFNSSNRPERAKPLFEEAYAIASRAGEEDLAIDAAHMLGICERCPKAVEWNEKALEMAENAEDPHARRWVGSLLNNLGWTYHDSGDYQRALHLFQKAVEFRKAQKKPADVRIAKWAVARALRSLGQMNEALAIQEELREEWQREGGADGFVFEELGECYEALGRREDARQSFRQAHDLLAKDPWLQRDEPDRLRRLKNRAEMEATRN